MNALPTPSPDKLSHSVAVLRESDPDLAEVIFEGKSRRLLNLLVALNAIEITNTDTGATR